MISNQSITFVGFISSFSVQQIVPYEIFVIEFVGGDQPFEIETCEALMVPQRRNETGEDGARI